MILPTRSPVSPGERKKTKKKQKQKQIFIQLEFNVWAAEDAAFLCFLLEKRLTWADLHAQTLRVPHWLLLRNVKLDECVREEELDGGGTQFGFFRRLHHRATTHRRACRHAGVINLVLRVHPGFFFEGSCQRGLIHSYM